MANPPNHTFQDFIQPSSVHGIFYEVLLRIFLECLLHRTTIYLQPVALLHPVYSHSGLEVFSGTGSYFQTRYNVSQLTNTFLTRILITTFMGDIMA